MAGKLGNTAAKLTPIEQWRAEKIREIYQKGTYLRKDLAKALGIHQSQVSALSDPASNADRERSQSPAVFFDN